MLASLILQRPIRKIVLWDAADGPAFRALQCDCSLQGHAFRQEDRALHDSLGLVLISNNGCRLELGALESSQKWS